MSIEIYKKVRFLYNPNAGSGITRLRAGGEMDAFLDFSIVPGSGRAFGLFSPLHILWLLAALWQGTRVQAKD